MRSSSDKPLNENTKPLFDVECSTCNFKLHNPIKALTVSDLVLYNDARFRGRSILALRKHREVWEDLEADLLHALMDDTQVAVRAIREATGCKRVNIAALSNTVSHIHLHLIPRFPDEEADPTRSPWRDPRPQVEMDKEIAERIILDIKKNL